MKVYKIEVGLPHPETSNKYNLVNLSSVYLKSNDNFFGIFFNQDKLFSFLFFSLNISFF